MSDKIKVVEIAEESGATTADVIKKAKDLGIDLKSPHSTVSLEDAEEITNYIMTGKSSKLVVKEKKPSKTEHKKEQTNQQEAKVETINVQTIEDKQNTIQNEEKIETPQSHYDETVMPRRRGLKIIKKGVSQDSGDNNFEKYPTEQKKHNTASASNYIFC